MTQPASGRADQAGHDPGGGQRREHPRPDLVRIHLAHHHVDGGDQQSDREALQHPSGDQQPHAAGQPRDHEPTDEQQQAESERQPRPTPVRPHAGDHHADDAGDQQSGERPAVAAQPVQAACGGRQRGGHRQRLEGDDRHQQQHADRRHPVPGGEDRLRNRRLAVGAGGDLLVTFTSLLLADGSVRILPAETSSRTPQPKRRRPRRMFRQGRRVAGELVSPCAWQPPRQAAAPPGTGRPPRRSRPVRRSAPPDPC